MGKNYVWQKFDQQKQFHLTKTGYLEQVCSNEKVLNSKGIKQSYLVRLKKKGLGIEIKRDLARFEDVYYEYQSVDFPGLEVTAESFTPYCVPDKNMILLIVKPQVALANVKLVIKQQYFILIDIDELKAFEVALSGGEDIKVVNRVFFCSPEVFLG